MQSHNTRPFSGSYQPPQPHKGAALRTEEPCSSSTNDLAKYLIRREMISSGLLRFDNRPENYWAWKASFCSATEDLNLTAREELDLLCKWFTGGWSTGKVEHSFKHNMKTPISVKKTGVSVDSDSSHDTP